MVNSSPSCGYLDKHVTYTFEVRDEMRYSKRKLLIRIEQADL